MSGINFSEKIVDLIPYHRTFVYVPISAMYLAQVHKLSYKALNCNKIMTLHIYYTVKWKI